MAVLAKDGTRHHSASRASMHDKMAVTAGAHTKVTPMKMPAGDEHHQAGSPVHPEPTKTPIEDHVAEHGPAHEIHYKHHEETDKHHLTSHHGEGGEEEMHHSVHDNAEAAHEHMSKAMGLTSEEAAEETPDDEPVETMHASGGGIPGMS